MYMSSVTVALSDTFFMLVITILVFIILLRIALKSTGIWKGLIIPCGLFLAVIGVILQEIIRKGLITDSETSVIVGYTIATLMIVTSIAFIIYGIAEIVKSFKSKK